jgi:hypothetical protein
MIINTEIRSERMSDSTIKQAIIEQLDHMPYEVQHKVLDYAQSLVPYPLKGTSGKLLLRFSGIIEAEDIMVMTQAIKEGCEQVDIDEW